MFGIPEYRLPKKVVRAEIAKIEALGVNIICNTLVGENGITVDSLFQQGFDAIFMGTGTAIPQNMNNTPGATLRGVTQSTDFLHNVNAYNEGVIGREMVPLRTGEKVGVIGGGVGQPDSQPHVRWSDEGRGLRTHGYRSRPLCQ